MKAWYLSEQRFNKRIIRKWEKKGFAYHYGHIQLLHYAYKTTIFWAMQKQNKVSQKNQTVGYPTLF